MHTALAEINSILMPYEEYWYMSVPETLALCDSDHEQFLKVSTGKVNARKEATEQYLSIINALTPAEIVEGYEKGCRTLKGMLGGHMYLYFDTLYIPTMIKAIGEDDDVGYLFIGGLEKQLNSDAFKRLILDVLRQERWLNEQPRSRTLDTALGFTQLLSIKEAIPLIEPLRGYADSRIAGIVDEVLAFLKS